MKPPSKSRHGLISVVVLVTLLVIGIIGVGLLRVALARRGEVRVEERKLQAEWLVTAALDRATARLAGSPTYEGETWDIPAADLGGRGSAHVVVRVEPTADQSARRQISVQADYPADSAFRARRSRSIFIELTPPAAEETLP